MKTMRRFLLPVLLSALLLSPSAFVRAADLTVTAGSVVPSAKAKIVTRTAGATITAGQTVYYDTATNTEKLADANASLAASKVEGIALNGASSGQRVLVCTEDPSFTIGATVVIGDTIWASATAGGVTKVAAEGVATGNYVSVIGVAISTTKINLKIIRADAVTP